MRRPGIALALVSALVAAQAQAAVLLVANKSEASLSLLRLPGFETVATLPTGEGPHEVAVSPDGRRALVTNYGTSAAPGRSLTLVDIASRRVLDTIELPEQSRPHGVEWLDNDSAAITAEGISSLLLVAVGSGDVSATIAVDQAVAHMVAVAPEKRRAFVANIGSGTASALDLDAARKLTDLASGQGAEGIALVRNEQELWVTNRGDDTVSIFSTVSLMKLATIPVPGFPIRAEADDPRNRVYVTAPRQDALIVLDSESRKEIARIDFAIAPDRERKTLLGSALPDSSIPVGVLLSGDGRQLFVAHTNSHVISVYDAQTLERQALLPVGLEPDGMAWSPLELPE